MPDPPCPERPLVPPEEKLWVGEVKVHNTITVFYREDDSISTADDARASAVWNLKELLTKHASGRVREDIDIDIHETRAFGDGE